MTAPEREDARTPGWHDRFTFVMLTVVAATFAIVAVQTGTDDLLRTGAFLLLAVEAITAGVFLWRNATTTRPVITRAVVRTFWVATAAVAVLIILSAVL